MNCKTCDNGLEDIEEQFEQCFACQKEEEGPLCYMCDMLVSEHDVYKARECLHNIMVQS